MSDSTNYESVIALFKAIQTCLRPSRDSGQVCTPDLDLDRLCWIGIHEAERLKEKEEEDRKK